MTSIPLVDIIVNIDCFVTTHEDRDKIIRIVKELFNHCTSMKSLLKIHHKLILNNLVAKYDKHCQVYINKATQGKKEINKSVVNESQSQIKFG